MKKNLFTVYQEWWWCNKNGDSTKLLLKALLAMTFLHNFVMRGYYRLRTDCKLRRHDFYQDRLSEHSKVTCQGGKISVPKR